jgi:hypothetical protein
MKNIILEELNKAKLLMKYNTKVTLSENLINNKTFVSNGSLLTEQPVKTLLKALFGNADEAFIASLKKAGNAKYLASIKILDDVAAQVGFKNGDEIATAMAKGTLKANQIGPLAKALLKQGKVTGSLRTVLTDKAANISLKKFPNMSGAKVKNDLIKKGYDPAIADEIAMKVANKNVPKNVPIKPTDVDDAITNITKTPIKDRTTLSALKKWGLGAGLTLGTIALLYAYFNDKPVENVTDDNEETPPPPPPPPVTNRYRNCTGTYTKGCKSEAIKPVQTCLGLVPDGKFWVKTQAALEAKGFPNGFTDADVSKICGNQTPPPPPAKTDDYGLEDGESDSEESNNIQDK